MWLWQLHRHRHPNVQSIACQPRKKKHLTPSIRPTRHHNRFNKIQAVALSLWLGKGHKGDLERGPHQPRAHARAPGSACRASKGFMCFVLTAACQARRRISKRSRPSAWRLSASADSPQTYLLTYTSTSQRNQRRPNGRTAKQHSSCTGPMPAMRGLAW